LIFDICGGMVSPVPNVDFLYEDIKALIRPAIPFYWNAMVKFYETPAFRSEAIVNYLIHRYELFLELVNENPHEELIPPSDIESIWLCHAIRTKIYREDCQRIFNKFIHRSLTPERYSDDNLGRLRARNKWEEKYGYPIDLDLDKVKEEDYNTIHYSHKITMKACDVVRDNDWVRDFYDSFYYNDDTCCKAVADYFNYLMLLHKYDSKKEYEGMISASLRVDLAWHTHMLNTEKYNEYCLRYFNQYIDHSPWPDYNETELTHVSATSHDLWEKEYGTPYEWKDH